MNETNIGETTNGSWRLCNPRTLSSASSRVASRCGRRVRAKALKPARRQGIAQIDTRAIYEMHELESVR